MSYEGIADFRSDTVTRPTQAMYEAIVRAPLGDDVFGDDPTVNELQDFSAKLFGKEAALWLPTGTQANQVAVRVHTRPGDEVILEQRSHTFYHEQGGLAALSGVQARTIQGVRGKIALDDVRAAIRPDNEHYPITRMIVLEQTHNGSGGSVLPLEYMREVRSFAQSNGLILHIDGARIANASVASGTPLSAYGELADSLTCCLSKGLAAPAGTVLVGSADFIRRARRARKLYGGGMRQVGILAAAGLIALRDMRDRLKDDHRRAAELAAGFANVPGAEPVMPETNMVYVKVRGRAAAIVQALMEHAVRALAVDGDAMRFVVHKDIDDRDIERAVSAFAEVVGRK